MMDPELMRLAQEQMSRMSPADLAQIQQQMMSNPELVRMATEGMQNMRPEDLRNAAEQLKHTRPEDLAEMRQKMANMSPEEIAAMRAGMDAQTTYKINAAQMLKKQGNELHSQGRYKEAAQKYLLAKNNLKDIPAANGRSLLCICSLNLMSSYLKTGQYDECVTEGTEVLSYDNKNVKALYRRGQAYKALGLLDNAVSDLTKAHENSPDDETIADVLRDVKEKLTKEGGQQASRGVTIEEITEEEPAVSSVSYESSGESSVPKPREATVQSPSQPNFHNGSPSTSADYMQALKDDPESIRTFQDIISRADPETLAALNNGKPDGISPDMLKTASNVFGKMSPEELQRMMKLASSFQGNNPLLNTQSENSNGNGFSPASIPSNVSPDMLKMATDMMSKMSPEDMQRMFQMSSGLKGADGVSTSTAAQSRIQETQESVRITDNDASASSTSQGLSSSTVLPQSSLAGSSGDMQEQMRNQMKDPAMRQMLSSMMKNISPEMMSNMSEQFGLKLSSEDAAKAQQAMSNLSPDDLDRMMKWADRIQKGVEGAKKTKNWLLGKPGMILAFFILLFAVFLHWLGYIGW